MGNLFYGQKGINKLKQKLVSWPGLVIVYGAKINLSHFNAFAHIPISLSETDKVHRASSR